MGSVLFGLQELCTHHWRCGQRHNERNRNSYGERHREFAEQTTNDATHQEDRNKDGHEGSAHREDGEANLP